MTEFNVVPHMGKGVFYGVNHAIAFARIKSRNSSEIACFLPIALQQNRRTMH